MKMPENTNQNMSQQAESGGPREGSLFLAVVKCAITGLGVGFVGVAICVPLFFVLWQLRELGLLLAFLLLPASVLFTRAFTREYSGRGTFGGAIALGLRYLLVGGWLALALKLFVVDGEISDTPFVVCLGGAIGTMIGSLTGAFRGWLWSQGRRIIVQDSFR